MDSHSRAKRRQTFPWRDWAGQTTVVSDGTRLRIWLDALRRTCLGCHADAGFNPADRGKGHCFVERLLSRIGRAVSAGCAWHRQICVGLPTLEQPLGVGGAVCRRASDCRGRPCLLRHVPGAFLSLVVFQPIRMVRARILLTGDKEWTVTTRRVESSSTMWQLILWGSSLHSTCSSNAFH